MISLVGIDLDRYLGQVSQVTSPSQICTIEGGLQVGVER